MSKSQELAKLANQARAEAQLAIRHTDRMRWCMMLHQVWARSPIPVAMMAHGMFAAMKDDAARFVHADPDGAVIRFRDGRPSELSLASGFKVVDTDLLRRELLAQRRMYGRYKDEQWFIVPVVRLTWRPVSPGRLASGA